MRLRLGLAAAAFTFAAGPALAGNPMFDQVFGTEVHPALAGHVELGIGPQQFSQSDDFNSWSSSNVLFKGAGRFNVPLVGIWNFEGEATAHSSWNSDFGASGFGAYAHLWAMFPGAAFGAFGGVSSGDVSMPVISGADLFGQIYTAGIEGETYLNQVTLGGQASFSTTQFNESFLPDYDSWQVRGYAAYYFTPDTKIVGDVRYTDFSANDFMPDQDRWDFIATLEHRFAGTPWSIWASGSYSTFSTDDFFGGTADQWSALIGIRLFMDAPGSSLYVHDRTVPFKYDNQPLLFGRRPV